VTRIEGRRPIEEIREVGRGSSARERRALRVPLGPAPEMRLEEVRIGRGRAGALSIGTIGRRPLSLSRAGRFLIDGRTSEGQRETLAIYEAAKVSAAVRGGLFGALAVSSRLREGVLGRLTAAIEGSTAGRSSVLRDKAFAGSATLLLNLARTAPRSDRDVREKALDAVLSALDASKNVEHVGFYVSSLDALDIPLTSAQKKVLERIHDRVLPEASLVEEYTENRTKPLEVRHSIHHEFWKEEIAFFSRRNGFTEVKRNAKDTRREYEGLLEDPSGKKAPLKVHVVVEKRELDYLDSLSDPDVHVILYSGHSAVGGNGSQATQAAGPMRGKHPKLLFAANCRGKDNYAELSNAAPTAHIIATEHPTYSDSGQARLKALFEMMARGETYAWMRSQTEVPNWEEPANNYFYPDQLKKFRFMDADEDGKIDRSILGPDALFDVERDRAVRAAGPKFVRALNFANSELFYHWELEHERGDRSRYGKKYADSLIAAGPLAVEKPGQLVSVRPVNEGKAFEVRYAPKQTWRMDQNVMGGHVTAQAIMGLARLRDGELSKKEALRAILMGAQAIHYLDVYSESAPLSTKRYFKDLGLGNNVDAKDIDKLFERYDTHGNDAQLAAFESLMSEKYSLTPDWVPSFRGVPV
jgi:hypothetical protein